MNWQNGKKPGEEYKKKKNGKKRSKNATGLIVQSKKYLCNICSVVCHRTIKKITNPRANNHIAKTVFRYHNTASSH